MWSCEPDIKVFFLAAQLQRIVGMISGVSLPFETILKSIRWWINSILSLNCLMNLVNNLSTRYAFLRMNSPLLVAPWLLKILHIVFFSDSWRNIGSCVLLLFLTVLTIMFFPLFELSQLYCLRNAIFSTPPELGSHQPLPPRVPLRVLLTLLRLSCRLPSISQSHLNDIRHVPVAHAVTEVTVIVLAALTMTGTAVTILVPLTTGTVLVALATIKAVDITVRIDLLRAPLSWIQP